METVFNYATNFFKRMSVISNVMDVINLLGDNGFVGLVVLIILFKFVDLE